MTESFSLQSFTSEQVRSLRLFAALIMQAAADHTNRAAADKLRFAGWAAPLKDTLPDDLDPSVATKISRVLHTQAEKLQKRAETRNMRRRDQAFFRARSYVGWLVQLGSTDKGAIRLSDDSQTGTASEPIVNLIQLAVSKDQRRRKRAQRIFDARRTQTALLLDLLRAEGVPHPIRIYLAELYNDQDLRWFQQQDIWAERRLRIALLHAPTDSLSAEYQNRLLARSG